MMQQKAPLFGDLKSADLIMSNNCHKEQKRLGRSVCRFNQSIFDKYSMAIVRQGNYNKLNQNPTLLNKLHATLGTTLVEASPHNFTWGIGLRESDPRIQQRETWLGQNKLGQVLTELRDEIFLEFKTLATINFSSTPTQKVEQKQEQEHELDLIGPEYTTKPSHATKERFTFFNGVKSIYHVNYIAYFTIASVTYNCVQQHRQYSKARLFDDDVRASQIMNATNSDEQRRLGSKVTHFNKDVWNSKTNLLMHEANSNKFSQNNEPKQELLATAGTTLAQACPFRGDWSTGYFMDEPNCHNRQQWNGMNKLGEILTNLREEILYIANNTKKETPQINDIATCFGPEVVTETLKWACPEIGHYFNYIEEKIHPVDAKWDRQVLNDYRDYYIRDGILWHISNTRGRTRSIQE